MFTFDRDKIAQAGLKSSPSLDWTDYVQIGVKWERDECKHKYTSERPQVWKKLSSEILQK